MKTTSIINAVTRFLIYSHGSGMAVSVQHFGPNCSISTTAGRPTLTFPLVPFTRLWPNTSKTNSTPISLSCSLYLVFCRSDCYLGCFNSALSFLPLAAWRAVLSSNLLSAGLLHCLTIISTTHSSRLYVGFQFHSLMVNSKYWPVSVPSVHIWCTVMQYCT